MSFSKEYIAAIAILAVSAFKAFGVEIENGVIEGILYGALAIFIAVRRKKKGDISFFGVRKA